MKDDYTTIILLPLLNHGLYRMPFAKNRSVFLPLQILPKSSKQSCTHLEIHLKTVLGCFTEFGMIPGTYENQPSSLHFYLKLFKSVCEDVLFEGRSGRVHTKLFTCNVLPQAFHK